MARADKKNADRAKSAKPAAGEPREEDKELVRKLPEEVQPNEEWGERYVTGKTIATGGKKPERQPSDKKKRVARRRSNGS